VQFLSTSAQKHVMARMRIFRPETIRRRLPPLCLECGAPADEYIIKRFGWSPPWVLIVIFAGLLPLLIVWILTRKHMTVDVPMCHQHSDHWARRSRYTLISCVVMFVLAVVCVVVGVSVDRQDVPADFGWYLFFGYLGVFIIWLVSLALASQSSIRPDEITEYDITLIKLSPIFVEALWDDRERYEAERRERRRRERERDYELDDREHSRRRDHGRDDFD
jgi:hypothetical protein